MTSPGNSHNQPSQLARIIAGYLQGKEARPVLDSHRFTTPKTLLIMALRDGDLHHGRFVKHDNGAIEASKLTPHGQQTMNHLIIHTAAREMIKSLAQDAAETAGITLKEASQAISGLCSTDPARPARTQLHVRAMRAEETFQAKLVGPDTDLRALHALAAPETLNACNALNACQKWLPSALANNLEQTIQYFRHTVNSPSQGKPYPNSPKEINAANLQTLTIQE